MHYALKPQVPGLLNAQAAAAASWRRQRRLAPMGLSSMHRLGSRNSRIASVTMVRFEESDDEEQAPRQVQLRQPPPGLRNEDLPALFWWVLL